MRLTLGERKTLEQMRDGKELTQAIPGGWWLEDTKISGKTGTSLLRNVLISKQYNDGTEYYIYTINEWGRKALLGTLEEDEDWKSFQREMRQRASKIQ